MHGESDNEVEKFKAAILADVPVGDSETDAPTNAEETTDTEADLLAKETIQNEAQVSAATLAKTTSGDNVCISIYLSVVFFI